MFLMVKRANRYPAGFCAPLYWGQLAMRAPSLLVRARGRHDYSCAVGDVLGLVLVTALFTARVTVRFEGLPTAPQKPSL
jgi:hypothetical protein